MKKVRIALALVAALGSAAAVACVLADPPPIVTPPPLQPPSIITDSVTPSPLGKIRTNPPCPSTSSACFVVPVIVDPNAAVTWRVFVDLPPTGPTPAYVTSGSDDGGVLGVTGEAGSGVRTFPFTINNTALLDPTQCHTFTFVIGYGFVDGPGGELAKPIPPGGDSVTWFYEPVDNCSFVDAGTFPEAGGAD